MSACYHVVVFAEGDDIAIVPEGWMVNKTTCWWPEKVTQFELDKLVKAKIATPDTENWTMVTLKVLGSYGE